MSRRKSPSPGTHPSRNVTVDRPATRGHAQCATTSCASREIGDSKRDILFRVRRAEERYENGEIGLFVSLAGPWTVDTHTHEHTCIIALSDVFFV